MGSLIRQQRTGRLDHADQLAGLTSLPNGAWEVTFGLMTAWFAYRVARDAQVSGVRALAGGHCVPHLVHAAAMLYMFLALTAPAAHGSGMSGIVGATGTMGTLGLPCLAFIFAILLIGYSIWDLDQLSGPGASRHYSLAAARPAPSGAVLAAVAAMPATGPSAAAAAAATSQVAPTPATGPAVTSQALAAGAARACRPPSGTGRGVLAPWVVTSCRVAMGITMAFMLLIMI